MARSNARRLARAQASFFGARSRLRAFLSHAAAQRASPRFGGLRWLSVLVLILFVMQLATGILLSLYYHPDPASAHESTRVLVGRVPAGWLVRSVHAWSAELLLVAALGHLAVVFFRRTYARPREYQWVGGVFLLLFLIAFRFTGRLLPWDTFGYEASQAGLDMLEHVPVLGDVAVRWLKGGEAMGAKMLGRFHTTHTLILPWLFTALVVLHLYLLGRHGLKGDDE